MTRVNPSPAVDNSTVTLCRVYQCDRWRDNNTILSVLAVLRRHKFEMKPVVTTYGFQYFCELREDISPWPRQALDQAMKEALPADQRNRSMPFVRWYFG
jgi:hypothetical protein